MKLKQNVRSFIRKNLDLVLWWSMVYHNTIPFGAPSQLRLQVTVDAQGMAHLAVWDPFDKPLGNLKDMQVPVSDLTQLLTDAPKPVLGRNGEAFVEIKAGHDAHHVTFDIHYEDPDKWSKGENTLEISDMKELLEAVAQAANAS